MASVPHAESQNAQYKVDFTYQYEFAKAAFNNGVKNFVLISSVGASPRAYSFYSKTKGQLEETVKKIGFQSLVILRPSFLDGERKESRPGEKIGIILFKLLKYIPFLGKYRPVKSEIVAAAMIESSEKQGFHLYEADEIFNVPRGSF